MRRKNLENIENAIQVAEKVKVQKEEKEVTIFEKLGACCLGGLLGYGAWALKTANDQFYTLIEESAKQLMTYKNNKWFEIYSGPITKQLIQQCLEAGELIFNRKNSPETESYSFAADEEHYAMFDSKDLVSIYNSSLNYDSSLRLLILGIACAITVFGIYKVESYLTHRKERATSYVLEDYFNEAEIKLFETILPKEKLSQLKNVDDLLLQLQKQYDVLKAQEPSILRKFSITGNNLYNRYIRKPVLPIYNDNSPQLKKG